MSQIKKKFIRFGTGTDDVNSRDVPANFTPTYYTPSQVASEGTDKTSAHLKGIDNFLGTVTGTYSHTDLLTLAGGGTLTLTAAHEQDIRVQGNSGAVTLSTTPFGGTPPSDGTIITVFGNSDTNTVTISNNNATNGCILVGTMVLKQYSVITFKYKSSFLRYVEVSRSE